MKQMIYYKNQVKIDVDGIMIDEEGNIEYDDEIYSIKQYGHMNGGKYPGIMVFKQSTRKRYKLRMHRAVAFTFNENYVDQPELNIHHKNGDKRDYSLRNLEIVDKIEHLLYHDGGNNE